MGLVQYQNWGNALSTLHTWTCYLSVCVHVCVCALNSWFSFSSSWALCLQWQPLEKKKFHLMIFAVFPAVAEPSSYISYCMYCRIKLIIIKKEFQQAISRLFCATCNIKIKWNRIFLDFLLEMEQHHSSNFPGKQCNCNILEEVIVVFK